MMKSRAQSPFLLVLLLLLSLENISSINTQCLCQDKQCEKYIQNNGNCTEMQDVVQRLNFMDCAMGGNLAGEYQIAATCKNGHRLVGFFSDANGRCVTHTSENSTGAVIELDANGNLAAGHSFAISCKNETTLETSCFVYSSEGLESSCISGNSSVTSILQQSNMSSSHPSASPSTTSIMPTNGIVSLAPSMNSIPIAPTAVGGNSKVPTVAPNILVPNGVPNPVALLTTQPNALPVMTVPPFFTNAAPAEGPFTTLPPFFARNVMPNTTTPPSEAPNSITTAVSPFAISVAPASEAPVPIPVTSVPSFLVPTSGAPASQAPSVHPISTLPPFFTRSVVPNTAAPAIEAPNAILPTITPFAPSVAPSAILVTTVPSSLTGRVPSSVASASAAPSVRTVTTLPPFFTNVAPSSSSPASEAPKAPPVTNIAPFAPSAVPASEAPSTRPITTVPPFFAGGTPTTLAPATEAPSARPVTTLPPFFTNVAPTSVAPASQAPSAGPVTTLPPFFTNVAPTPAPASEAPVADPVTTLPPFFTDVAPISVAPATQAPSARPVTTLPPFFTNVAPTSVAPASVVDSASPVTTLPPFFTNVAPTSAGPASMAPSSILLTTVPSFLTGPVQTSGVPASETPSVVATTISPFEPSAIPSSEAPSARHITTIPPFFIVVTPASVAPASGSPSSRLVTTVPPFFSPTSSARPNAAPVLTIPPFFSQPPNLLSTFLPTSSHSPLISPSKSSGNPSAPPINSRSSLPTLQTVPSPSVSNEPREVASASPSVGSSDNGTEIPTISSLLGPVSTPPILFTLTTPSSSINLTSNFPSIGDSSPSSNQPSQLLQNAPTACFPGGSNGFFGDQTGNNEVIRFQYELEFPFGTDPATDIIPKVKKALIESVRSVLSVSECSSTRNLLRRTHNDPLQSRSRRLEVTGMDPSPFMRILDDAECHEENMIDNSNDCVVVEGDLVVFTDDTGDADTAVVEDALKAGFEDNELLKGNGHVDRVTFIEAAKKQGTTSLTSTSQKRLDKNSTWITMVVVVAVALGF